MLATKDADLTLLNLIMVTTPTEKLVLVKPLSIVSFYTFMTLFVE